MVLLGANIRKIIKVCLISLLKQRVRQNLISPKCSASSNLQKLQVSLPQLKGLKNKVSSTKFSIAKVLLASFWPPVTIVVCQTNTEMVGNRLNLTIDT